MSQTDARKLLLDARDALGRGELSKAKKLLTRVNEGDTEGNRLLAAIDGLASLQALEGDVEKAFEVVDAHALVYWNNPGQYRSCAITVRVRARLALAEWLAKRTGSVDLTRIDRTLRDAKEMSQFGRVEGLDAVAKRIRAAARKTAKVPPLKARKLRPLAKKALAKARSWKRKTVKASELVELARLVKREGLTELATAMDDFDGDAFVWDGDLEVDGDFRPNDVDATWLVVRGDLVVKGLFDSPNEHAFVTVTGSLRAGDVITASSLDVLGDVEVAGVVLGDYNDGGAHVRGGLRARLFAPTDHPFKVDGKVRADFVLSDARGAPRKGETAWDQLPLAAPLGLNEVAARLRAGFPILRVEK